jgi:hypothetical protein
MGVSLATLLGPITLVYSVERWASAHPSAGSTEPRTALPALCTGVRRLVPHSASNLSCDTARPWLDIVVQRYIAVHEHPHDQSTECGRCGGAA